MALAGIRGVWAVIVFAQNRKTYLEWRVFMLHQDAIAGGPPSASGVPTSLGNVLANLNW